MTPSPSSCPTPIPTPTPTPTLLLTPLSSIRDKQTALTILSHLNRLEKKTFPASEAFDFSDPNLWRKKPNTRILYATSPTTTPTNTNTNNNNNNIIAYAVYVRLRDTALLHKVCVAEGHRGKGVGRELMRQVVEERVGKGERGCRVVQLWVDEGRGVARRLYRGCGFEEVEWVRGYYGAGRGGVRMVREMGGVMG